MPDTSLQHSREERARREVGQTTIGPWTAWVLVVQVLLVVGGLCYTGGLGFYAWRSLPFSHSIWHSFVLSGSILHFVAYFLFS